MRNLWRIRRFINNKTCLMQYELLLSLGWEYCNSLFTLLLEKDFKRLKSIQNSSWTTCFQCMTEVCYEIETKSVHSMEDFSASRTTYANLFI